MFGQTEPEEAVIPHKKSVPLNVKTRECYHCLILQPRARRLVN